MQQIEAIRSVLEEFNYIEFALLFGSVSDGKAHALSDIDIALHTDTPLDLLEQGYLISALEEATQKRVDLVLLNDLYKTAPKLAFNIVDRHSVILQRDRQKYIDFKTATYKYYFDHEQMYRMFDDALRKRLQNGTYGKTKAS